MNLETPGGLIEILDDVRTVTAARYQRFSAKHLEMSVGSDVFAADSNLRRMAMFLSSDDVEAAKEQFNHLVQALSNIQNGIHGPAVVLAPLVGRIGPEECNDLSDVGLLSTAEKLLAAGITQAQLTETLERVKKTWSATS